MATIWLVRSDTEPTWGDPLAEISVDDCISRLELQQADFLNGPSIKPRFRDPKRDIGEGPNLIVIELGEADAREGWRSGFYLSAVSPDEAIKRLKARVSSG